MISRIGALVAVLAVAVSLGAVAVARAQGDGPVVHFPQRATLGFYRGQVVEYLDFGPVKLAGGNKVAPIWAVTNGAEGQRNVIDTVPGRRDYTPLWAVRMVTWKDGETPRLLRSATDVLRAQRAGDVTITTTDVVVNCPLI
jgi:hypothetical protein